MARGNGSRRRALKKLKALQGVSVDAQMPEESTKDVASTRQSDVLGGGQQSIKPSPWWRELSPEQEEKARAQGLGAAVDLMRERRAEISAVTEFWPVSRDVRERLVYESLTVALDHKADPRLRQRERWMLQRMAEANRVKGLPEQIDPESVVPGAPSVTINIGAMVRELLEQPGVLDAIDFRPFKPERNGPDDYAE